MKRRPRDPLNHNRYPGPDPAGWSDAQLAHVAGLTPGKLAPLGFARWRGDPAEVIGLAPRALIALQEQVAAEVDRRST